MLFIKLRLGGYDPCNIFPRMLLKMQEDTNMCVDKGWVKFSSQVGLKKLSDEFSENLCFLLMYSSLLEEIM